MNPAAACPAGKVTPMTRFRQKPGTKSASRTLKRLFPDAGSFDAVVQSVRLKNPFGCTSYMIAKHNHPPVEIVREMYTAKFVYTGTNEKQIGRGSEVYNSREGYEFGIAAMISNMANIAAHRGKVRHIQHADHFSALLKCHDPNGELYFLSIARDRLTLSSYSDNEIRRRVEAWAEGVPGAV